MDLFAMGDYGQYVWPCYALVFATLIYLVQQSFTNQKKIKRKLKKFMRENGDV